jgi:hypothetical protein
LNEAETRAEHIDPALRAAGWGVVEGSRIRREYPIIPGRLEGAGRRGRALTADYVLEYRNTKLAVVEAKAWGESVSEGLAKVAFTSPPLSREQRAERARVEITTHFNSKQRVFLEFVLSHYVRMGFEELAQEKLSPLLHLKYSGSIADAKADLGPPEEIARTFAGFQKYLYAQDVA